MVAHFMIHFSSAFHANELYSDETGNLIYDLDEAIEESTKQYPDSEFEIYNGSESWDTGDE